MSPRTKATGYRSSLTISRLIITLLGVATLAAGCGRSATDRELDRVDAVMESDPELADAMLDSISPGRGADRARHALYRLVATGKLTGAVDNDSLLTLVADRYCTPDAPVSHDAMIANFYRGTAYMQKGDTPEAVRFLTAAEDMGETVGDSAYFQRLYGTLALLYQNDYNGPMLIKYSKLAMDYGIAGGSEAHINDLLRLAYAYTSCALDSLAWPFYDEAIASDVLQSDTILFASALAEYGISKALSGDTVRALQLLSRADSIGMLSSNAYSVYAWLLDGVGQKEASLVCLKAARHKGEEEGTDLWKYYSALLYERNGDYKNALMMYHDAGGESEEKLMRRLDQPVLHTRTSILTADKDALRREREMRIEIESLSAVIVSLVIVLLVGIAVWIYRNYKNRYRILSMQMENLHEDIRNTKSNIIYRLEYSQCDQKDYDANVDTLANMVLTVVNALEKIGDELNDNQINQRKYLDMTVVKLREITKRFFEGGDYPVLYSYIDNKYSNVMSRIRSDMPRVSDDTLRMISLSFIGLSKHNIAFLLNIDYGNVRQNLHRLKTRLCSDKVSNSDFYRAIFNKNL